VILCEQSDRLPLIAYGRDFCGSGLSLKAVRSLFTLWVLCSFSIQVKCASFVLLEATLTPSWLLSAACSIILEFHEIEMLDVCKSHSAHPFA
jgi:hypothetical protein